MRLFFLTLISVVATTAQADTLCTFDLECLEGETCAETAFTAERAPAEGQEIAWMTDAETLTGQMIASDENMHFVFEAPSAAHLLTEYPDGSARYTVHLDGPFTITYHGTCEGKP